MGCQPGVIGVDTRPQPIQVFISLWIKRCILGSVDNAYPALRGSWVQGPYAEGNNHLVGLQRLGTRRLGKAGVVLTLLTFALPSYYVLLQQALPGG